MTQYERVELIRDCDALLIPTGIKITLQRGLEVVIFQSLGDSYTVNISGNLARIAAHDADALGKEAVPEPALVPAAGTPLGAVDEGLIVQQLRTCYDPEIPVNIYDLGLIYDHQIIPLRRQEHELVIKMTLTAPGCGMGDVIAEEIKRKLLKVPHVVRVTIDFTFDPPWDRSMMSEEAKLVLGMM